MKLFEITNPQGMKVTLNLFYMHSFRCMTIEADGAELAGFVRLVMSNGEVYHLDGTSTSSFLAAAGELTVK